MFRQPSRALPACDTEYGSRPSPSGTKIREIDSLVAEVIKQLPTVADFQGLLNQIAELAKILTGATGSAIAFRGEYGTVCRATSGRGVPPIGAPVDVTSGLSKRCLDSGTAVRCDDIARDARSDPHSSEAIGSRSMAVVPIYSGNQIAGILAVFSRSPAAFTDQHIEKLQHLAGLIDTEGSPSEPVTVVKADHPIKSEPNLRLLVEREPAYRAFFQNLASLSWTASHSPYVEASDPHAWDHIFVESQIQWKPFFQSIALHIVMVGMLLGLSRIWPREKLMFAPPLRDAHITYYPASQAYSARASRPPVPRTLRHAMVRKAVASGGPQAPAIRVKSGGGNTAASSLPPPEIPAAALKGRSLALGPANSVVPAPPTNGLQARLGELPRADVVAPSPELGGAPGA